MPCERLALRNPSPLEQIPKRRLLRARATTHEPLKQSVRPLHWAPPIFLRAHNRHYLENSDPYPMIIRVSNLYLRRIGMRRTFVMVLAGIVVWLSSTVAWAEQNWEFSFGAFGGRAF